MKAFSDNSNVGKEWILSKPKALSILKGHEIQFHISQVITMCQDQCGSYVCLDYDK